MRCGVLNDGACDCKLVQRSLARVRRFGDEILENCVYDCSIPGRGTSMFIAGYGLERGIAGLEVQILLNTQIDVL